MHDVMLKFYIRCKRKYLSTLYIGYKENQASLSYTYVWCGEYFNPVSFKSILLKYYCSIDNIKINFLEVDFSCKFWIAIFICT